MKKINHNHPCKGCIVLPRCTEMCDKVSTIRSIDLKKSLKRKECPDCGSSIRGKTRNKRIIKKILLKNENWSCKVCKHDFKKFNNVYYRDVKLEFEGMSNYYSCSMVGFNDSTCVTNYQVSSCIYKCHSISTVV
jgi:hypothetical protein